MQDFQEGQEVQGTSPTRQQLEQTLAVEMQDYPLQTRADIVDVIELQYANWQRLRSPDLDQFNRFALESLQQQGRRYLLTKPSREVPKRELTDEERQAYDEMEHFLAPFASEGSRNSFFHSRQSQQYPNFRPDTRFYLSLTDSPQSPELIKALTQQLESLVQRNDIPFWEYKIDGADEHDNIRFDPRYRDKGASVIVYVHDSSLNKVSQVLESLHADTGHNQVFLPQKAPFKFAPHGKEFEPWHVAMEYGMDNNGNTTPEMAIASSAPQFIRGIGLHERPVSAMELWGSKIKAEWENAWASEHRDPQRPWITIERPTPQMLLS